MIGQSVKTTGNELQTIGDTSDPVQVFLLVLNDL